MFNLFILMYLIFIFTYVKCAFSDNDKISETILPLYAQRSGTSGLVAFSKSIFGQAYIDGKTFKETWVQFTQNGKLLHRPIMVKQSNSQFTKACSYNDQYLLVLINVYGVSYGGDRQCHGYFVDRITGDLHSNSFVIPKVYNEHPDSCQQMGNTSKIIITSSEHNNRNSANSYDASFIIYDFDTNTLGTRKYLNTDANSNQLHTYIALLKGTNTGRILTQYNDFLTGNLMLQELDMDGNLVGSNQVSVDFTGTSQAQDGHFIYPSDDGGYVKFYNSKNADGSTWDLNIRVYDSDLVEYCVGDFLNFKSQQQAQQPQSLIENEGIVYFIYMKNDNSQMLGMEFKLSDCTITVNDYVISTAPSGTTYQIGGLTGKQSSLVRSQNTELAQTLALSFHLNDGSFTYGIANPDGSGTVSHPRDQPIIIEFYLSQMSECRGNSNCSSCIDNTIKTTNILPIKFAFQNQSHLVTFSDGVTSFVYTKEDTQGAYAAFMLNGQFIFDPIQIHTTWTAWSAACIIDDDSILALTLGLDSKVARQIRGRRISKVDGSYIGNEFVMPLYVSSQHLNMCQQIASDKVMISFIESEGGWQSRNAIFNPQTDTINNPTQFPSPNGFSFYPIFCLLKGSNTGKVMFTLQFSEPGFNGQQLQEATLQGTIAVNTQISITTVPVYDDQQNIIANDDGGFTVVYRRKDNNIHAITYNADYNSAPKCHEIIATNTYYLRYGTLHRSNNGKTFVLYQKTNSDGYIELRIVELNIDNCTSTNDVILLKEKQCNVIRSGMSYNPVLDVLEIIYFSLTNDKYRIGIHLQVDPNTLQIKNPYEQDICIGCQDSNDECIICKGSTSEQRSIRKRDDKTCTCQDGYFDDLTNEDCQSCSYQCESCHETSTKCKTCKGTNRNNLDIPDCSCSNGFYDNGSDSNCVECHYKCSKCNDGTSNCVECKGLNRLNDHPTCTCEDGFYDDGSSSNCQQCDLSVCVTCVNTPTECIVCKGFKKPDACTDCIDKYFDNGIDSDCQECDIQCLQCENNSNECTQCDGSNRESHTNDIPCACLSNYFHDGVSANPDCLQCHSTCLECQSQADNCISCISRHYDDGINSGCQECAIQCQECVDTATKCISCNGQNRSTTDLENCPCAVRYYHDGTLTNPDCQECNKHCATCEEKNKCLTCNNGGQPPLCIELPNTQSFAVFLPDGEIKFNKCKDQCASCVDSSSNCTQCTNTQYLVENGCLAQNGNNQLNASNCPKGCNSCDQIGRCLDCEKDTQYYDETMLQCMDCYIFQGSCVSQCPQFMTVDESNKQCLSQKTWDTTQIILVVILILVSTVGMALVYKCSFSSKSNKKVANYQKDLQDLKIDSTSIQQEEIQNL